MKVTQMHPVHASNLVANSGNTAYGVDIILPLTQIELSWDWHMISDIVWLGGKFLHLFSIVKLANSNLISL